MSTLKVNTIQEVDGTPFSRIVQVVSTKVTSASSFALGGHTVDTPITALDTTITSKLANSSFIYSCQVFGEIDGADHDFGVNLGREIGGSETKYARGDANGSNERITRTIPPGFYNNDNDSTPSCINISPIVDSPSQAAGTAIKYRINVQALIGGSYNFYLNRTVSSSTNSTYERGCSYVTIMELAV